MIIASMNNTDDLTSAADTIKMTKNLVKMREEKGFEIQMWHASIEPKTRKEKNKAKKYLASELERIRDMRKLAVKGIPFKWSENLLLDTSGALTDLGHRYWAIYGMKPDDIVPFIGTRKVKAFIWEASTPKNLKKVEAWYRRREAKVLRKYKLWQTFFEHLQNDPYIKSLKPIEVTRRTRITFAEAKARQQKMIAMHPTMKRKMAYPGGVDGFYRQIHEDEEIMNSVRLSFSSENLYSPAIEKAMKLHIHKNIVPVNNIFIQDILTKER